jgi:hypothetical protein
VEKEPALDEMRVQSSKRTAVVRRCVRSLALYDFYRELCSFVEHQRPAMVGMVHEVHQLRVRHADGARASAAPGWNLPFHRVTFSRGGE